MATCHAAESVAPFQPSESLKPTAMGSDLSEPAVSSETANRRMSEDKSGPLSDKPDGTTPNAQVNNTGLSAGGCPNKTPTFIEGASDTRSFLAWLRESCSGGLTAQLKGEKLMVVPATADGFRAVVSALRSLDGREGVSFHTFTLSEDRCMRLLVKNLGRGMTESVVREELESLNICVQGVMQLRSGRRDQNPAKNRPPIPSSLSRWRVGLICRKYVHSPNSANCECRWSRTWPQKAHCNAGAASVLDTRSVTVDTRPGASHVAASTSPVGAVPRENSLSAVAGGNQIANYRGCIKWKEAKAAPTKQAPEHARKRAATGHPAAPKAQRGEPSAEQMDLSEGWNQVFRGGVSSRLPPPLHPQSHNPLLNRSRRRPSCLK
jgi:hypothetical protein